MATRPRSTDPRAVPVAALARDGEALAGEQPLAAMARLAASLFEVPTTDAAAAWQARFGQDMRPGAEPQAWLELEARAHVVLQCQRCLKALPVALSVERRFQFVASEAEAEKLDADSDDDLLVLAPRLNLAELLEDELILALPLVPRHEADCPQPLAAPAVAPAAEPERPNPFAALAALRRRPDADTDPS